MKMIRYLACLLLPIFLASCGLFIAPRNEVIETTLRATLDGWVDDGSSRNFTDAISIVAWSAPRVYTLLKFPKGEIPLGAQILSAKLRLHISAVPDEGEVIAHRILQGWDETIANTTVNNLGGFFEGDGHPTYIDSTVVGRDAVWEIRKVVQNWANGAPNYGVILEGWTAPAPDEASVDFFSIEGGHSPELYVRYY